MAKEKENRTMEHEFLHELYSVVVLFMVGMGFVFGFLTYKLIRKNCELSNMRSEIKSQDVWIDVLLQNMGRTCRLLGELEHDISAWPLKAIEEKHDYITLLLHWVHIGKVPIERVITMLDYPTLKSFMMARYGEDLSGQYGPIEPWEHVLIQHFRRWCKPTAPRTAQSSPPPIKDAAN